MPEIKEHTAGGDGLKFLCAAKLNLSLDVVGVRKDGYHLMDMVMQSVTFFDTITISAVTSDEIKISSDSPSLPIDRQNLVYRAAVLLAEHCAVSGRGLDIHIEKRIPAQAGLGGGSADAAGTLLALRKLWKLPVDDTELASLGLMLGADVPFCLLGGTARVGGIGEKTEPLRPLRGCWFVIVMPKEGSLTKDAFRKLDEKSGYERPDTFAMVSAVSAGDIDGVSKNVKNVFETSGVVGAAGKISDELRGLGALGAAVTGSGAAVFGVFGSDKEANDCLKSIKKTYRAWIARPAGRGVFFQPSAQ